MNTWRITNEEFKADEVTLNGARMLISNGYMGYRGTLEEFRAAQKVGITLSGIYNQVPGKWREPVNAPNPLWVRVAHEGRVLNPLELLPAAHEQSLDIRKGTHTRKTRFLVDEGLAITLGIERFVHLAKPHCLAARIELTATRDATVTVSTGIDADVWDINGPHITDYQCGIAHGVESLKGRTTELGHTVAVCAGNTGISAADYLPEADSPVQVFRLFLKSNQTVTFERFASIWTALDDSSDPPKDAGDCVIAMQAEGYDSLRQSHLAAWKIRWERADVLVEGDAVAQQALRYSLYQLMSAAASHRPGLSIPARALSGQVYKGGIFWDTELFMLPFFVHTLPELACELVLYRCRTLDGARRKAAEYGYRGAFYAWESQESGDDACTDFNVDDIFSGRPLRTYFRDKQIHISADVAWGIWRYWELSGDDSILIEGGAEAILECARFFYSWAHFKPDKGCYELLDVVGPDEYHDRVNNNAFTNRMAAFTLDAALHLVDHWKPEFMKDLLGLLKYAEDIARIRDMRAKLTIPQPDSNTGLIEQFDGYFKLENVRVSDLKARELKPNEYWGGHGIASTTQVLKQADVLMMMNVFPHDFSPDVRAINWDFYEPRTEHGSSLSACAYATVAAQLGRSDHAYPLFLKTATIDLTGKSKQMVGSLYIGGTHPAANGGAWMTVVYGFAGMYADSGGLSFYPHLPENWKSLSFMLIWRKQLIRVTITQECTTLAACESNTQVITGSVYALETTYELAPGRRQQFLPEH